MNWEDIFDIVETKNGFFAVFKHDGRTLNTFSPCKHRVYAESIAFNWVNSHKNEKKVLDIISELTLLGK
jgi:hypothetical protein